ncbi:MAG: gamma-glutamylcyclotransferase [Paracoccaceae bacterium]|nr:gamma-glutamylcyclotransferase [Paracoccaceae bacterium]
MDAPLWVFGYGSLMWNPEFPYRRREVARIEGFHRSFCMSSIHHRGTEDAPGLVLALDETPGAVCDGIAFEVAPEAADGTLHLLRERELISSAYVEHWLPLRLGEGGNVEALAYVIEKTHVQYRGDLGLEEQAQIIHRAVGGRGPNTEYLYNTVEHLAELGIVDADLDWLARRVRVLEAEGLAS